MLGKVCPSEKSYNPEKMQCLSFLVLSILVHLSDKLKEANGSLCQWIRFGMSLRSAQLNGGSHGRHHS
jgi:hypothetical protein